MADNQNIASDAAAESDLIRAQWQHAYKRLAEFARLEDDWDAEGAEAPEKSTIQAASIILAYWHQQGETPPTVTLSHDGEIALTLHSREGFLQFVVAERGRTEVWLRKHGDTTWVGEIEDVKKFFPLAPQGIVSRSRADSPTTTDRPSTDADPSVPPSHGHAARNISSLIPDESSDFEGWREVEWLATS